MPTPQLIITIAPDRSGQPAMLVSLRSADGTQSPPRPVDLGQDGWCFRHCHAGDRPATARPHVVRADRNPGHADGAPARPQTSDFPSSTRQRRPRCRNVERRHQVFNAAPAAARRQCSRPWSQRQRNLVARADLDYIIRAARPSGPRNSETPAAMMPRLASFIALTNADISACAASSGVVQPSASG